MKLFILALTFLFNFTYPQYNTCIIVDNEVKKEIRGNFDVRLIQDSMFIYLNSERFKSYKRNENILFNNKEVFFLSLKQSFCRITQPRANYELILHNGQKVFY